MVKQQEKMGLIFSVRMRIGLLLCIEREDIILVKAARNGNEEVIKLLLDMEGTLVKKFGNIALTWASYNGHAGVVKMLLKNTSSNRFGN